MSALVWWMWPLLAYAVFFIVCCLALTVIFYRERERHENIVDSVSDRGADRLRDGLLAADDPDQQPVIAEDAVG